MATDIQTVVFDFGGVMAIVYRPALFRSLEIQRGLQPGSLSDTLWRSPEWQLAKVGTISDEEHWQRLAPRLGLHTSQAIRDFQLELFGDVRADPRMVSLIRELRGRYQTALLSNASDSLPRLLCAPLGIDNLFDVQVISAVVGLAKPDPAIFRLTLERLGTPAAATIFVDDSKPNIEAAAELGIQGILFSSYEALLPDLRQRGVDLPE